MVVLVAFLFFFFQMLTIIVFFYGFLALWCSDEITYNKKVGSPLPDFSFGILKYFILFFMIIGFYWAVCFWNNYCDFTVSASAVNYYFHEKQILKPALLAATGFHIGSIAFASLILTPVSIINFLFGWFYDLATDDEPNII